MLRKILIMSMLVWSCDLVSSIDSVTLIPTRCNTVESQSVGKIVLSTSTENYTDSLDCRFTMTATSPMHRLRFAFNTGRGDTGRVTNPNGTGCSGASVQIFDGPNTTSSSLTDQLCGDLTSEERLSSADTLTILVLSTGGNGTVVNFTAHYTSFTEGNCGGDFQCTNGKCISSTMLCDPTLINNCGDFSDNSPNEPANCSGETTPAATVPVTTISTTTAAAASSNVYVFVAAGLGGAATLYFLHWLLFRPGWLVWRLGCLRHTRCCRGGGSGKNTVDAVKPTMHNSNGLDDIAHERKSGADTPTPTENTNHWREYSESPFVRGIQKEKHLFSLDD